MSNSAVNNPVITGIGAVSPVGNDRESSWTALLAGRSGVAPISLFDTSELPIKIAAEVKDFDAEGVMGTKRYRRSARFTHFAVAAAREAVEDAGLAVSVDSVDGPPETVGGAGTALRVGRGGPLTVATDRERVGVVVNSTVPGAVETEAMTDAFHAKGLRGVSSYYVPAMIPNMPACEVAIDLAVHGPVTASALACASGNAALLEARRLILSGDADVVLCGGTDAGIGQILFAGLVNMGALAIGDRAPEETSRPFDLERNGFVFGEGAVVFVMESAAHAAARGADVYGSVLGGALTADAFHISHPDPSGAQPIRALSLALKNTRVAPEDVDLISAHGTATKINDALETRAIRTVLGAAADDVMVTAPKSMTGHMIAAAGATGALVALLAMRDSRVPPTANLHTPDPECDLDYVPLVSREAPVRTALVNAFGFGGQNCVLVLQAT